MRATSMTFDPVTYKRLKSLQEKHEATASHIIRMAIKALYEKEIGIDTEEKPVTLLKSDK